MDAVTPRRLGMLAVCLTALIAVLATVGAAAASQAQYDRAYRTGLAAYTYGLPLLKTDVTFRTMTSIGVSKGAYGPVNRFNNVRKLNNPGSKAVVAPGASALSSIAWADLRQQPQVLHVPRVVDHSFVLALLDPYTTDLMNLGSVHGTRPGDYVLAGPGQHDLPIPAGTHRIELRYSRLWIIGSTQLRGKWDLKNVHRIQDRYTLTPLSRYGTVYRQSRPAHPRTRVTTFRLPRGLRFFDMLGRQLASFPPPAADRAALRRFAQVGIGPGMRVTGNRHLSRDTVEGLKAAVAAGKGQIKADLAELFKAGFEKHDGYLLGGFGSYGTDYRLRAVVATIGLGAFTSDQAIFAISPTDRGGEPLDGSAAYVMHLRSMPPITEGWSVTVYTLQGFLVPNKMKRYQLNDRSKLTRNPDGSVDIYLQPTEPADPGQAANWLPTPGPTPPGQGFEVIWRLMGTRPASIPGILDGSGWQPPAITPAG
jgi:hypothetical protein